MKNYFVLTGTSAEYFDTLADAIIFARYIHGVVKDVETETTQADFYNVLTYSELDDISKNIAECIGVNNLTDDKIIDYVSENFFTFSDDQKTQIINFTIESFISFPFC